MGKSRRHHKRFQTSKAKVGLVKRTTHKNPRKPEAVKLPGGEGVLEWAQKGTLQSNYEAAGLAVNPNKIGEKLGKRGDIVELVKVKDGKVVGLDEADDNPDDEEIADELRGAAGRPRKEKKRELPPLTKMQRVYVRELQAKHKDDFEAMAKDIKLNKLQHTPGALKYLFERYLAHPKLQRRDQAT
ncbi:hypothetical protein KFL_000640060 [Klebsormidium nitens]|uniref:Nucleolar protein 16 n=1 Tax=Klebsormidium nitens TaxID=105231 RepID=A0A1Y1HQD8_KLENI|nr:hypothetical protein KFL_000640060 [Klebsormidium nitens]|eukprot:GAQ80840.1 hypothetical protein KFL_000640060 [Klebsormidium nitens]